MSGAEGRHRVRDNVCQVQLNVTNVSQDWRRARLLVWQKTPGQVECKTQKREECFTALELCNLVGTAPKPAARRAVSAIQYRTPIQLFLLLVLLRDSSER